MNSIIDEIIPQSNFEKIRNRIAAILALEFDRQLQLSYDQDKDYDLKVWLERIVTFQTSEMPCINVKFAKNLFDNKNQLSIDGNITFHIDVWTRSKDKGTDKGDTLANLSLAKILRAATYILNHPKYKTLGFAPGMISNIMPKSIQVTDSDPTDSQYSSFGRLELQVRAVETNTGVYGTTAADSYVTMKIYETQDGYYYGFD